MTDATERLKAENAELRKRLEDVGEQLAGRGIRLRRTCQILVEAIGADGPCNAEEAAERAVERIASLTAQLAAAEAEIKRRNDYDERVPDPRHHKYFNFDCTTGCKWLVAQREAAELRELVEAYRNALVEIADWSEDSYGRTQNACSAIANKALARLTPAKPAAVEGGGK